MCRFILNHVHFYLAQCSKPEIARYIVESQQVHFSVNVSIKSDNNSNKGFLLLLMHSLSVTWYHLMKALKVKETENA